MRALVLAAAGLLICASAAVAAPPKPVVLKAARLFDGKSDKLVTPGIVVVRGEKIEAAGPSVKIPADAEVIDLGDATLSPGFIDAHTHLTFEGSDNWTQDQIDGMRRSVAETAILATTYAKRMLLSGFTTARDLGSSALLDIGLRNAIDKHLTDGPHMIVAVNAIGATGGHCDFGAGFLPGFSVNGEKPGIDQGIADSPEQARAAVRWNVKYGADVIKTCATGGVFSLSDEVGTPELTEAELAAIVDEAHALHKKVAAHAHGAEGAKRAIRAGVDSIEHGSLLDDDAWTLMKTKGTTLVITPTPCLSTEKRRAGLPPEIAFKARALDKVHDANMKRAIARGVKIGFGTDSGVCPHGTSADVFPILVSYGMKPIDTLKAATSVDAKLLGADARIGTLEQGKLADVIAIAGDPVADIKKTSDVVFVMKEGAVYKNTRGGIKAH
jgi:imidazolonepropionase-like amidohydrolase